MRTFILSSSTYITALGAGIGTLLGLIFFKAWGTPTDAAILGAFGGLVVSIIVLKDFGALPKSPPHLVIGGLLGPILLGAMGGFVIGLRRGDAANINTVVVGALLGAAVSFVLQRTQRTLPLDLTGPVKYLWNVVGLLMEAATGATQGAITGAIVGAILGAVGGGIAIVGLMGTALGAAALGALMGAIVGAVVGLFGAR